MLGPGDTFADVVLRNSDIAHQCLPQLPEPPEHKISTKEFRLNPFDRQEVAISILSRLYILASTCFPERQNREKQFAVDINSRLSLLEEKSPVQKATDLVQQVIAKRKAGAFVSGKLRIESVELHKFIPTVRGLLKELGLEQAHREVEVFEKGFNRSYLRWKSELARDFRQVPVEKDDLNMVNLANLGTLREKVGYFRAALIDVVEQNRAGLEGMSGQTLCERRLVLNRCHGKLIKPLMYLFKECFARHEHSESIYWLAQEMMHAAAFLHVASKYKPAPVVNGKDLSEVDSEHAYTQGYFKFMAYLAAGNILGLNRELDYYFTRIETEFDKIPR